MIDNFNMDTETMRLASKVFGEEKTFNHTTEECAELIVAINHFRRRRITKEQVAEEIADVYIMCNRLATIIGVHLVDQKLIEKMIVAREAIKQELINDQTRISSTDVSRETT